MPTPKKNDTNSGSGSNVKFIILVIVAVIVARSFEHSLHPAFSSYTPTITAYFGMNAAGAAVDDSSFALASSQSFGFFDDVRDSDWKIAQKLHLKAFPNHFRESLDSYDKGFDSSAWYGENFQEEFHCAYAQRIPSDSSVDGAKWVCDPHRIAKKKDCLVYSVGSFGNTVFERGVKSEIGEHCEVHTFDVEPSNARNGDFKSKVEAAGASFHLWGIGTKEQAEQSKNDPSALNLKTLKETMEILNHTGRTVDVFKIDCEMCEWVTYKEWYEEADLRQVLVETHHKPGQAKDFFYSLHDAGYVIFSKEHNYLWSPGVEFAFIKLSKDFFIDGSMYSNLGSNKK